MPTVHCKGIWSEEPSSCLESCVVACSFFLSLDILRYTLWGSVDNRPFVAFDDERWVL